MTGQDNMRQKGLLNQRFASFNKVSGETEGKGLTAFSPLLQHWKKIFIFLVFPTLPILKLQTSDCVALCPFLNNCLCG